MAMSTLYLHTNFSKDAHHSKVFKLATWDPYSYTGDPWVALGSPETTKEAVGPGTRREGKFEQNTFFGQLPSQLWLVHVPVGENIALNMPPCSGSSSQLWLVYVSLLGGRDIGKTYFVGPPKPAMIGLCAT